MSLLSTRARRGFASALVLSILSACGGGGGSSDAVTPPAPTAATVTISGNDAAILPGATLQLAARAATSAGVVLSSASINWSTSNAAVATVSSAGLVSAVAAGTATVSASSGSASGTTEVRVNQGGVIAPAGGTVADATGKVTLNIPAGAVTGTTAISITAKPDTVRTGHTVGAAYLFGPTGTQFAQPVTMTLGYDAPALPAHTSKASLRVARLTNGVWVPLTEGVQVDSAAGKVRAQTRSFSTYAVVRDPCQPQDGAAASISGAIAADDCLYQVAGRRSDYYTITPPANEMFVLKSSGTLDGLFGLKQATVDATTGTVYDSDNIGRELRFVGNGSALQLFVSGRDSTKLGAYTFTKSPAVTHACPNATAGVPMIVLMPGARYSDALNATNSCSVTVQFSPIPAAIGQQLRAHYYAVKLDAGRSYTIAAQGFPGQSALTIFSGGVVAQSVGATSGLRTLTFTAASSAYYTIEISSGGFENANLTGAWIIPNFAYSLTVSAP